MNLFKRLFSSNTARTTDGITFTSADGEAGTLNYIRNFAVDAKAGRVFVIGGLTYLSKLTAADFPGYEVFVNRNGTFGWLLSICEYLQRMTSPAVLVSAFPRQWENPQITLQINESLGMILEPYDAAGGTIETATAPPGMTLRATPEGIDAAFCFVKMSTLSYYAEVLRSQGCPPKQPKTAVAIIDLASDAEIDSPLIKAVRGASYSAEKQKFLREFAETEENRCRSREHGTLRRTFTGGIMRPGFHPSDVFPPGALTPREIAGRKS